MINDYRDRNTRGVGVYLLKKFGGQSASRPETVALTHLFQPLVTSADLLRLGIV
jgi:hypothetical protein